MAWQTARNMDRLRADVRQVRPGVVVYDIGDLAHARGRSGHNPDDMTLPEGGSAELSDPDGKQEVRALDFMIGPAFTAADARALVAALRDPRSRLRLYYVIYNRMIHRRDGLSSPYGGSDPHTNHVHASGYWTDDDNASPWPAVLEIGEDMAQLEGEQAKQLAATTERVKAIAQLLPTLTTGWANNPTGVEQVPAAAALKAAAQLGPALAGVAAELAAVKADLAELKARPAAVITQDMLNEAVRMVMGSVDGATPQV